MSDSDDRMTRLGEFIRERRNQARLSLRKLSEQAGISNPYLSQIERGLRKPSAEILQSIAKALRISAETLYVQAGILDAPERDSQAVATAIYNDASISERQKQVLVDIYESFRRENRPSGDHEAVDDEVPEDQTERSAEPGSLSTSQGSD